MPKAALVATAEADQAKADARARVATPVAAVARLVEAAESAVVAMTVGWAAVPVGD